MNTSRAVHVCYTRLCFNIANEIADIRPDAPRPGPAVTHMLIVGTWKLYSSGDERRVEGDMAKSHSFSSSLPAPVSDPKNKKLKSQSRNIRKETLAGTAGAEITDSVKDHHNYGNCAETLNILGLVFPYEGVDNSH